MAGLYCVCRWSSGGHLLSERQVRMNTEDTDRYGAACGGSAVRGEQRAVYTRPPVGKPLSRWARPAADAGQGGRRQHGPPLRNASRHHMRSVLTFSVSSVLIRMPAIAPHHAASRQHMRTTSPYLSVSSVLIRMPAMAPRCEPPAYAAGCAFLRIDPYRSVSSVPIHLPSIAPHEPPRRHS